MKSTLNNVVSKESAVLVDPDGRIANVSNVNVLGVVSVNETLAVPSLSRVPPTMLAVMSKPSKAFRVKDIVKVYWVLLSYPWFPVVAPFAKPAQFPLVESKSPDATFLSINRNGLELPSVVYIFMNIA